MAGGGGARQRENPDVGFPRDRFQRALRIARGNEHFEELRADSLDGYRVHLAIEGDNPAEGRGRIGRKSHFIGCEGRCRDRRAAGIRMLDDDARGFGEGGHALPRRVAVGDIVV